MFGVTPDIKIISFGVRQLKNRRVTPNGEQRKDKKRTFWAFWQTKHDKAPKEQWNMVVVYPFFSALAKGKAGGNLFFYKFFIMSFNA